MANYIVTGAAGFIGSHVTKALLEDGNFVIGIDDLNDAYDVRMKKWRLRQLRGSDQFVLFTLDIGDRTSFEDPYLISLLGELKIDAISFIDNHSSFGFKFPALTLSTWALALIASGLRLTS